VLKRNDGKDEKGGPKCSRGNTVKHHHMAGQKERAEEMRWGGTRWRKCCGKCVWLSSSTGSGGKKPQRGRGHHPKNQGYKASRLTK